MPDTLRKIPFDEALLVAVAGFDCGDEEWERPLAGWINAGPEVKNGALHELRKRKSALQVWLHVNEADELVGYSSLGASGWQWPTADDPRMPISVIPNVAIQKRFWGCPKDDPPRYSAQILQHLVAEARDRTERQPLLGLFVHPLNVRAIKAYKAAGFDEYFRRYLDPADGVEYRSMLLKLAPERG